MNPHGGSVVADLHNEFSSLLVEGIRRECERQTYRLLAAPAGSGKDAQDRLVEDLIDRGMDGIVMISPLGTDLELQTVARNIPSWYWAAMGTARTLIRLLPTTLPART